MPPARPLITCLLLALSGCALQPFHGESAKNGSAQGHGAGSGPVVPTPAPSHPESSAAEAGAVTPAPPLPPKERPKTPPATLNPASRALVSQAQAQRKKGDLPGATVSLERALRIEPSNPLLWIEMGRLRMDQHNYPQAEAMGRKALAMSVGDSRTQSSAWQLIGDSFKARGKNPQAQDAFDKARELAQL